MELLLALIPVATGLIGYVWGSHRQALKRKVLGRQPIHVHIEQDPDIIYANDPNWVSFPYFFPNRSAGDIPPPPQGKCTAWWKWARELGGEPAGLMELQVTITAWEDLRVIVDALRIEIVSTPTPPIGTTVVCPVGGADLVHQQLAVTLSEFASSVIPRAAGSAEATNNFAFSLGPNETCRFSLSVTPSDEPIQCYEWVALLDLLVNNERKTVTVDNDGRPFVLHTEGFRDAHRWDGENWKPYSS
jgi:hypothetical protein